jgi:hypothetical protein
MYDLSNTALVRSKHPFGVTVEVKVGYMVSCMLSEDDNFYLEPVFLLSSGVSVYVVWKNLTSSPEQQDVSIFRSVPTRICAITSHKSVIFVPRRPYSGSGGWMPVSDIQRGP